MTERSYVWEHNGIGDASLSPYSDDEWADIWSFLINYAPSYDGVLFTQRASHTGMLEVTNSGTTINVATGAALVNGRLYRSNATVSHSATGSSVWHVVGLRESFAAQTVRSFIRGTYASRAAALASLVKTDGTTWEIPLATVEMDGAGAVNQIMDERYYIPGKEKVLLGHIVLNEDTASVDWQSVIPTGIFSRLRVECLAKCDDTLSGWHYIELTFNADSGTNYDYVEYTNYDSAGKIETWQTTTGASFIRIEGVQNSEVGATNNFSMIDIDIAGCFNTNSNTIVQSSSSNMYKYFRAFCFGDWDSTVAVNQVTLTCSDGDNFIAGSGFRLYGML